MRFLHTMIRVGDLDKSIKFYTEVMGLKLNRKNDYPGGKFTLAFLGTEDGANLLAGYKRAANILKAEEKKGALPDHLIVDGALIDAGADQEIALHQTLGQVRHALTAAIRCWKQWCLIRSAVQHTALSLAV